MSSPVVIWDIDDVIHPWYKLAHQASVIAGIAEEGKMPTTWYPYEEYGVPASDWFEVLDIACQTGYLYQSTPSKEVFDAWDRIAALGYEQVFVTARGFMNNAERIKYLTECWIAEHWGTTVPVYFSRTKGEVAKGLGARFAIDDNAKNWKDLTDVGVRTYLLNQPWNADADVPKSLRVKNVTEFRDVILRGVQ